MRRAVGAPALSAGLLTGLILGLVVALLAFLGTWLMHFSGKHWEDD